MASSCVALEADFAENLAALNGGHRRIDEGCCQDRSPQPALGRLDRDPLPVRLLLRSANCTLKSEVPQTTVSRLPESDRRPLAVGL